jgi:hypothetical protein
MTELHIAPRMNRQPERGVISILFALLLPLLLGFGAFAIDYPNMLSVRTQMQTAADAAALGDVPPVMFKPRVFQPESLLLICSLDREVYAHAAMRP